MAQVYGAISEFVFDAENFTEWIERLEQWFIANDVTQAAKKRAVLLSNIGARGYKLIRSLSQNDPTSRSYADLKRLMLEHLHPKPNEIAQRYIFFKRDRRTGESVKDYVAELRKLSEHCNFGHNLHESLRDRFVCGLNDERVQQRLLATSDLTLKLAVDTATAMEAAARSARQIHNRTTHTLVGGEESSVNQVGVRGNFRGRGSQGQGNQSNERKDCHRCGSYDHLANTCPKKDEQCHKCKKFGHTQAKCRKGNNQQRTRRQGKVYYGGVEDLGHESVSNEDYNLVEEGLNFVTLYRLETVDIEDEEESNFENVSDQEEEAVDLDNEVRKYKEWVESTFHEYWECDADQQKGEQYEDYYGDEEFEYEEYGYLELENEELADEELEIEEREDEELEFEER